MTQLMTLQQELLLPLPLNAKPDVFNSPPASESTLPTPSRTPLSRIEPGSLRAAAAALEAEAAAAKEEADKKAAEEEAEKVAAAKAEEEAAAKAAADAEALAAAE